MELRHLRYFLAVAEEGHITRAAQRLGMQQPPLSQQIRALERELQVQLFHRRPRGVELTDAGRALQRDSVALLAGLERACETARRAARGEQGQLCLGVTSTSPFHPLVPRVLRAFNAACPEVALTLEEGLSNELIERLGDGRLDVAFVRVAAGAGGLAFLPLLEEPMVLALPAGHPLADGDASIAVKRLQAETFILAGPPGTGLHDAIIEACRAVGFSPRVGNLGAATQQAPRISSTLSLVAAGLGITCVPASLMRLDMEGVVFRHLAGRARPKAVLGLTSRRGDPSAVVRRFVALVRREARVFSAEAAGV